MLPVGIAPSGADARGGMRGRALLERWRKSSRLEEAAIAAGKHARARIQPGMAKCGGMACRRKLPRRSAADNLRRRAQRHRLTSSSTSLNGDRRRIVLSIYRHRESP